MKKYLVALSLMLPAWAGAQLKVVAEGPVFEEPESGHARLVLMKNGNTAFVRATPKDGIDVRLYNAQHKQIAVKNLEPDYGKLRAMSVKGLYDLNGELNLFISEVEEKIPSLYRLRIDGQTGVLKELKTIATLERTSMGQGYAAAFGGVPMPDFMVRKDPASDNYGVVRYNTFVEDRTKRVELIQYNADGSVLSSNFLSSPEAKYKFTQILDFVVVGKDAYALIYSFNTRSSGGAANELLLASVKNGQVSYVNVGKAAVSRIDEGILRYNPVTNNLIFLALEKSGVEGGFMKATTIRYSVKSNIIDLANADVKTTIDFRSSSYLKAHRKIFKNDKDGFSPLPQELYINADGSFTTVFEETTQIMRTSRQGSTYPAGVMLGSIAAVTYNEDGTERSAALVPKLHTTNAGMFGKGAEYATVSGFYIADRNNSGTVLASGNQFKSFAYLNGKNKSYILLNDVEENDERVQEGKLINIQGVSDCDGWLYDLSTTRSAALPIPNRTMAFGKKRSKDHNLGLFTLSDFDREHGIYATLKLEKGEGVKIVWMNEE
jgi:hypothetical protein